MKVKSEKENISFSKRTIASVMLITYLSVLSPFSIFAQGAEKVVTAVAERTQKEEKSEVLISAVKGGKVTLGEACIEIPEGALKEDTKISITRLINVEETGESLYNAIPKSGGYRFLPAGTKFEKEVTITLPYNPILNSKPQSLEDMYTYFYDTDQKSWIKLERLEVDEKNCVVRSLSTHFTDMINATLTLPEAASPIDVNLNSIKNLEAAKPDSHLIKFNQPKATNMGDASFSFELGIPAGRKGVQPQISVSYSSGGGNGIMGKGFDISYASSITTDTRFGLPKYDTNDTMMLDGIILEKEKPSQTSGDIRYKATKESSFSKIVRKNAGTSDDYWEVTDKSGTKRIYAQSGNSCVGSGKETFTWNLTKIEDTRKNNVIYKYEKDANGYVYPLEIKYTGQGEKEGNYSVKFIYDTEERKDIRIDARSGTIISCVRLLKSVETYYKTSSDYIRKYTFDYTEGLAKEKILTTLKVNSNADNSYEYTFDYTLPEYDGENIKYFSDTVEEWNNGKPIQLGNSTSVGSNFNASAGGGYGTKVVDLRTTGGGSGSQTTSESYTEETLIDINGDGRPDSIKQVGNTLKVYLNNGHGFGEEKTLTVTDGKNFPSDMEYTKSSDSTYGWNVYNGVGAANIPLSAGIGYSEVTQDSSSSTITSFMDMDRDGLVDIVEMGKQYYLKNNGDLTFTPVSVYSTVAVTDVVKTLTAEEKTEYQKAYFVQTPFRMWKAPYSGIGHLRQSAAHIDPIDSGVFIRALTYKNGEVKKSLSINDFVGDATNMYNENVEIGDKYYFISNNGIEPINSSIMWHIQFEYQYVKSFKRNYPVPYVYMQDYKKKTYSKSDCHYGDTDDLIKNFIKNQLNGKEILYKMYEINEPISTGNGLYYYSITYNPNWKTSAELTESEQIEIYKILNEENKLIPAIYTKDQFDAYFDSLKEVDKKTDEEIFYRNFALAFTYDVVNERYILKNSSTELTFSDSEIFGLDFFDVYPVPEDIRKAAFENYVINEISPIYSSKGIYYQIENKKDLDNFRSQNSEGTMEGQTIYVGAYDSKKLYFNKAEQKFVYLDPGNGIQDFTSADSFIKVNEVKEADNNLEVVYGLNVDNKQVFESTLKLTLSNISYLPDNLYKDEYLKILDSYILNCNAEDPYWDLTEENTLERGIKVYEVDKLFEGFNFTEEQKNNLINALYTQDYLFSDEESGFDEYYINKAKPDYTSAQKIFDEYKISENAKKSYFPCYEFDANDQMAYLKDEFKGSLDKEEKINEWKVTYPEKEDFEGLWNEFCVKIDSAKSECQKNGFGKYGAISVIQDFNPEHNSKITNNTYSISKITDLFALETINYTLDKTVWSTSTDFSTENKNVEKTIFTITKTDHDEDNNNYTDDVSYCIKTNEFLYGGDKNWFYGIWKGCLNDVEFSEHNLAGNYLNTSDIDKAAFDNAKTNVANNKKLQEEKNESSGPQNKPEDESVCFYLPQLKSSNEYVKDIKSLTYTFKDNNVVDLSNALIGTVAINLDLQKVDGEKKLVDTYSMPFIHGEFIHVDRAGGDAYYKIEGIDSPEREESYIVGKNLLTMPSIRRSHDKGKDYTPTANVKAGPFELSASFSIGEDGGVDPNFSASLYGVGGNIGTNSTTSTSEQIMQDINGDGVPDIVQLQNRSLVITEGSKINSNGEICFNKGSSLSGVNNISKNETNSTVYGASVSGLGSAKVKSKTTSLGNIKNVTVEINSTPTASGGKSYSEGTSTQKEGLADINGDGLPDYFDGNDYFINTGKEFLSASQGLYGVALGGNISKSSSDSCGMNFNLTLPGGLSANLSEATSLKCTGSGTVGITYNSSSSNTKKMMIDINGDGLQDILEMSPNSNLINVSYNTGNQFVPGNPIYLPGWGSKVTDNSASFYNIADGNSFDFKIIEGIPVIGAGLKNGLNTVAVNSFGYKANELANSLDWNSTISIGINGSIGANINIGIDIITPVGYYGTINITAAGGAGANASTSINGASVKMMDLDGDGLVDHVLRVPGVGTYWKRNISGKYFQLKQINLPQGGNVQIEYAEQFGDEKNPGFKYVMSKVIVNDGCDRNGVLEEVEHGEHSITTKFTYADGYYDRQRKDFMGYKTVTTENPNGTKQIDTYYNQNYYSKGSLEESVVIETSSNKLLSKSKVTLWNEPYQLPAVEENWIYETSSGDKAVYTATTYKYDDTSLKSNEPLSYGNCTEIVQDFGDGDKLTGEISYNNENLDDYIIGLPKIILVKDKNNKVIRHREGNYSKYGELKVLKQYYTGNGSFIENTITYDSYGNISTITDGNNATVSYEYDADENMFPVEISQTGENCEKLTGTAEYDPRLQTKKYEQDCNGNKLKYNYDDPWNRLTDVYTSYDDPNGIPAVHYEYFNSNAEVSSDTTRHQQLWYTVTNNKVTFDSDSSEDADKIIQTVVQIDGLGRAVRTAKTGYVRGEPGWNISGCVEYDNAGRTVKEYMTDFVSGPSLDKLLSVDIKPSDTTLFTEYSYDSKDRPVQTILPDKSVQTAEFMIDDGMLISIATDPLKNISEQWTDSRGNIVYTERRHEGGNSLTHSRYEYNSMGEMTKAFNAMDMAVEVEYDLLGRRTAVESPDSGRQEFVYDKASNVIRETNSVLRKLNKEIEYEYDGLNRLVKTFYPDIGNGSEEVIYTYGTAGNPDGAVGKIWKVEDASGTMSYAYGKLGEIVKETRRIKTHLNGPKAYEDAVMEYRSDYLGRMQWIIYPDGEKITYGYDDGGQVVSVKGVSGIHTFDYVNDILYDEYGQRVHIEYGNGTFTDYTYDPARRWLDLIKTQNGNGHTLQNITYKFDLVGNVDSYDNNCIDSVTGNYKTAQKYTYDNLYQLIGVEGTTTYNPHYSGTIDYISSYNQTYNFDDMGLGRMTRKISQEETKPQKRIGDNLIYDFEYVYDDKDGKYSYRLLQAGDRYYQYDENGNIICEQDGSFDISDTSYHKINKEDDDVYSTDYGWGLYKENTDGQGFGAKRYRRNYTWNAKNQLIVSKDSSYETEYVYGQNGERSNKFTSSSETMYFNKMWIIHVDSGNRTYGGQSVKNIYLGETRIVTKLNSVDDPTYNEEYYKQYYYHSDHLGSAALITDYNGGEYQRIEYTPYGETWVEKTTNTGLEYLPYKFSAKELDEETGLYYYGARYLDPKYSVWISSDPALGEYVPGIGKATAKEAGNLPGMGGVFNPVNFHLYHYAGNNPIRYTDPDGRTAFDSRWWSRNWDNLISLGINFSEFLTGVGIAGTTGITGAGAFYGTAMAVHGGLNTAVSVCKIAYTTVMADMYGDDYADRLDARLPDTALGFVGYMMGSLADALVGYSGSNSAEKVGALFDIFDTACGIAISMNLGNLNKAVDSFAKDVGHLIPKKDLIKLQKYLESAGKYTAVDFIKGVIEKYDTISGVYGNAKQVVE